MGKDRKVTYPTWEEFHREDMKDPRYLFWWLLLAPKFWLIRFWMWIGHRWELLPTLGKAGAEESKDGR
jgi:hypothetical protein